MYSEEDFSVIHPASVTRASINVKFVSGERTEGIEVVQRFKWLTSLREAPDLYLEATTWLKVELYTRPHARTLRPNDQTDRLVHTFAAYM